MIKDLVSLKSPVIAILNEGEKKLSKIGFKKIKYEFTGGPFTSIAYFVDQAIQYSLHTFCKLW